MKEHIKIKNCVWVRWFKEISKYRRNRWRKENARRQSPARMKDTKRMISLGLREGTRCSPGIFHSTKS
jgi:hypothetical protein